MNKNIFNWTSFSIVLVTSICVLFLSGLTARADMTCINLSHDIGSGSSDAGSQGFVSELQHYLKSSGYFKTASTGYFGPATTAAVKLFQGNNNIPASGYVGPLTRTAIKQKTCSIDVSNSSTVTNPVTQTLAVTTSPVFTTANGSIISPSVGQVLSVGSSTVIRWSKPMLGTYNLSLEQPGGSGAGFIVLNQSTSIGDDQYLWKVGRVYLSQPDAYQNVVAGTYRIRLQSAGGSSVSSDQMSGWFTIVASQLAATSVIPSSAYADDATSIVLFGSGFTMSSSIYFDTNYSNLRATKRYVSPDGTVLVFTIPTTVPAGQHTLLIGNDNYNSTTVPVTFIVSATN